MATTDSTLRPHEIYVREPSEALEEALLYVILRYTDMDLEDAYSAVFRGGAKITWN